MTTDPTPPPVPDGTTDRLHRALNAYGKSAADVVAALASPPAVPTDARCPECGHTLTRHWEGGCHSIINETDGSCDCRYQPSPAAPTGEPEPGDCREQCRRCNRRSPVGFTVPDEMWRAVMGDSDDVLCLFCWDDAATAAGVPWSHDVQLWPVDGLTGRDDPRTAAPAPSGETAP